MFLTFSFSQYTDVSSKSIYVCIYVDTVNKRRDIFNFEDANRSFSVDTALD